MAFDRNNFDVAASSKGAMSLLVYRTTDDAIATVIAASYFDSVHQMIRTGDVILVDATDDTRFIRVQKSATNVITVTRAADFT